MQKPRTLTTVPFFFQSNLAASAPVDPAAYSQSSRCDISAIFAEMPACTPRLTLVNLPLPEDPYVVEVYPSHVEVERCAGACVGNSAFRCVPSPGGRQEVNFDVSFKNKSGHNVKPHNCQASTF